MSTANADPARPYAECDEFIDYQIQVARDRIRWTDLLTASVLTGILLVGYVLAFTVFDHWVVDGGFGPWTRAILLVLILVVCAAIVVRFVVRPWLKRIHPLYAARMLDRSDQGMNGALLSLVDLKTGNHKAADSIRATLEKRAAVRLSEINVDEAIDRRWLIKFGTVLFVLVLVTCLYAVFSPKSISLLRPLTLTDARVATRTAVLQVQPGDVTLPAGSQLEIVADISGRLPEQVRVSFTTADRRFVNEELVMQPTDDERRFTVLMVGEADRGIRQDLTYHIVAGDATSDVYTVTVDQPPRAEVTAVEFRYPDYMNLPGRRSDSADIAAWEGSAVLITAESTVPVESGIVRFSDDSAFSAKGEEIALSINGTTLTGTFELLARENGTFPKYYRIEVEDAAGRTDPSPTVHSIKVRQDQAPVVELLDPIRDLKVPANAVVPMLIEARDPDFYLRSVTLFYEINGHPVEPGDLIFDGAHASQRKSWTGTYELNLAPLDLKGGDVVRYYVAARDNKPPLGNQGRTGTLQLEILAPVSQQQVQERLQQDRELQERQLQERESEQRDDQQSDEATQSSDEAADEAREESAGADAQAAESSDAAGTGDDVGSASEEPSEPGAAGSSEASGDQSGDQSGAGETGAGQESSDGTREGSRSRPASDDEALQKLIQKYQQDAGQDSGAASASDEPGSPDSTQPPSGSPAGPNESTSTQPPAGDQGTGDAGPEQTDVRDPGDAGAGQATGDPGTPRDRQGDATENSGDGNARRSETGDAGTGETPSTDEAGSGAEERPSTDESATRGDQPSDGTATNEATQDGSETDTPGDATDRTNAADPTENPEGNDAAEPGGQDSMPNDQSGTGTENQEQQANEQQDGGQKDGGQQGGGQKGGGQEGGGQEGGGQEGGGQEGGGQQGGGEQGGGQQGGGEQGGGEQGGGEQGGGQQGGGQQGGGQQGGGQQGGGEQGGGEQGGGQQGGGEQGGGEQGGGEQGGGEQGGGEQGGGEQGGGQQGGGQQGGGQQGGGQKGSGGGDAGGGGFGSGESPHGAGGTSTPLKPGVDPNVEDAAKAADLALKRLQQDLERGNVDKKMLEELGWTEDQLDAFRQRMQKQLQNLQQESSESTAEALQRRRVEELLKSMNLQGDSISREGDATRDREQQDTTVRRPDAPSRYKNRFESYLRSVSGVRDGGMER